MVHRSRKSTTYLTKLCPPAIRMLATQPHLARKDLAGDVIDLQLLYFFLQKQSAILAGNRCRNGILLRKLQYIKSHIVKFNMFNIFHFSNIFLYRYIEIEIIFSLHPPAGHAPTLLNQLILY